MNKFKPQTELVSQSDNTLHSDPENNPETNEQNENVHSSLVTQSSEQPLEEAVIPHSDPVSNSSTIRDIKQRLINSLQNTEFVKNELNRPTQSRTLSTINLRQGSFIHSAPTHSVPSHSVPSHSVPSHSVPSHSVPSHSMSRTPPIVPQTPPNHSVPASAHSVPTSASKADYTTLINGERINKADKLMAAIGAVEELSAYIGLVKAEHFNINSDNKMDTPTSAKFFVYARFTQIQESLNEIIISMITSNKNVARYNNTRFSEQKHKELEQEIEDMGVTNSETTILSGSTILEAQLLLARTICRRAERQVIACRNVKSSICPDNAVVLYLNRLSDYLYAFTLYTLQMEGKQPLLTKIKLKTG